MLDRSAFLRPPSAAEDAPERTRTCPADSSPRPPQAHHCASDNRGSTDTRTCPADSSPRPPQAHHCASDNRGSTGSRTCPAESSLPQPRAHHFASDHRGCCDHQQSTSQCSASSSSSTLAAAAPPHTHSTTTRHTHASEYRGSTVAPRSRQARPLPRRHPDRFLQPGACSH